MSDMQPDAKPAKPGEKSVTAAGKGADWWAKEVRKAFDHWKDYRTKARKVIDRYRDERGQEVMERKRFNILYSNTETLGPVVYSQAPVADIRRRFQDKDDVARMGATVLQRATQYSCEAYDFDGVLDRCKLDYLLPGFAVARVLYKPYFKGDPAQQQLIYQEVSSEYVPWDRFTLARVRTYERAWWAAVADDLTRDEVKAQFGAVADQLSYSGKLEDKEDEERSETVRVWEVWCKRGRVRFFLAEGYPGWLKEPEADPLRLENFYPWPKPMWSITTNESMIPVPEYLEYQDQALELDDLTERIDVLTSALRRRGVYDATNKDVLSELANASDNTFKPIDDWKTLIEKGGLASIWLELPIDNLAKIVLQLVEQREQVKQTIYEVTGLSDIIRGASNPNETATAQGIKGRWAGLRVSARQKKFATFARDLIRLKAEVIAERFDPQTLQIMSGIQLPSQQQKQMWQQQQQMAQQQVQQYQAVAQRAQQAGQQPPPPPQVPQPSKDQQMFFAQPTWEEVVQVLRNDKLRGYKIDIETDSTVAPDADAEKQARTELLAAIGTFSQEMGPAVQQGFMPPDLASSLIKFAIRAFKVGSEVEQELEQMGQNSIPPQVQQMQKQLQEQKQQLDQQAAKVKDDAHSAELKRKDAEMAAKDAQHAKQMLDVTSGHQDQLRAQEETHAKQLHQFARDAEGAVRDAVSNAPLPQHPPQAPVAEERGEKPQKQSPTVLHIHTAGEGKRKPRKFRLADSPDGSSTLEEMLEQDGGEG